MPPTPARTGLPVYYGRPRSVVYGSGVDKGCLFAAQFVGTFRSGEGLAIGQPGGLIFGSALVLPKFIRHGGSDRLPGSSVVHGAFTKYG